MFPRIHPFALGDSSSRSNVYSRHESNFASSASSVVTKILSSNDSLHETCMHKRIIRRSSGRFVNLCLYSRSKFHSDWSLVRSGFVVVDKSVGATMVSGLSSATSFTVFAEQSEIREANSSHISATAP